MVDQENSRDQLVFGICAMCKRGYFLLCVNGLCSDCCGSMHFKKIATYHIKEKSYDGNEEFIEEEWVEFHNPQIVT